MKLALHIALLLVITRLAMATVVSGTVRFSDGSSFNGQIVIRLVPPGLTDQCHGGLLISGKNTTVQVVNGVMQGSVDLTPTDCMNTPTPYEVAFKDKFGNPLFTDRWWIGPDTGITFNPPTGSSTLYPTIPKIAHIERGGYNTITAQVQAGLTILNFTSAFPDSVGVNYTTACDILDYPNQNLSVTAINNLSTSQIAVTVTDSNPVRGGGTVGTLTCRAQPSGAGILTAPTNLIPTITSLIVDQSLIDFPGPVTFTSTTSPIPQGIVNFIADGANSLGLAPVDPSTGSAIVSSLGGLQPGDHSITATYEGSQLYQASTSVPVSVTVLPPVKQSTSLSLTASPSTSVGGQNVTFTATILNGVQATGLVTFMDTFQSNVIVLGGAGASGGAASFTTASLAIGVHSVTASYAGDLNYLGSTSAPVTVTVNKSNGLTANLNFTAIPNPATDSTTTVTLNATVTGTPTQPTGSVSFTDNGASIGTATLNAGNASTAKTFSSGTHTLQCSYSGDVFFSPTSAQLTLTVGNGVPNGCSFSPSSSLVSETVNNTAACSSAAGYCNQAFVGFNDTQSNVITNPFNPAPGHVGRGSPLSLMYSGATTQILSQLQMWFCKPGTPPGGGYNGGQTCGGHLAVGYDSNDSSTLAGQVKDMMASGFNGTVVDWFSKAIDGGRDDAATQKLRTVAEGSNPFKFAVMEDGNGSPRLNCPPGGTSHSVTVSWTASTSPGVTSYNVKRSTQSGGPYSLITNTAALTYSDVNVVAGQTYFYVVSALAGTLEGDNSNQAQVTVPNTSSGDQSACLIGQIDNDIDYLNTNYFGSSAYLTISGRPVLFFLIDESLWAGTNWSTVWSSVRTHANTLSPQPLFAFQDGITGSHPASDAAFAALNPQTGTSTPNQTNYAASYLSTFYSTAAGQSAQTPIGAAYKGYDDFLASYKQNPNSIMSQQCGQVWLNTFTAPGASFNSGHQLPFLNVISWNDYEGGSEIETGIDNCYTVSAINFTGANGTIVNWQLNSTNNTYSTTATIDHFNIWLADASNNLQLLGTAAANATSFDFGATCIATGQWKIYVQMVGKSRILSRMSNGLIYGVDPAPAPTVASVTPSTGVTTGGTAITVTGTNFRSGATVALGGTYANSVAVTSATTITASTAAHAAGTVNVVVTNTDGTQGTLASGFTYTSTPPPPPSGKSQIISENMLFVNRGQKVFPPSTFSIRLWNWASPANKSWPCPSGRTCSSCPNSSSCVDSTVSQAQADLLAKDVATLTGKGYTVLFTLGEPPGIAPSANSGQGPTDAQWSDMITYIAQTYNGSIEGLELRNEPDTGCNNNPTTDQCTTPTVMAHLAALAYPIVKKYAPNMLVVAPSQNSMTGFYNNSISGTYLYKFVNAGGCANIDVGAAHNYINPVNTVGVTVAAQVTAMNNLATYWHSACPNKDFWITEGIPFGYTGSSLTVTDAVNYFTGTYEAVCKAGLQRWYPWNWGGTDLGSSQADIFTTASTTTLLNAGKQWSTIATNVISACP